MARGRANVVKQSKINKVCFRTRDDRKSFNWFHKNVALQNSALLDNYLRLVPSVDRKTVENDIMTVVSKVHDKNTLGIRLLNTLIHTYFINEGELEDKTVDQRTFQTELSFEPNKNSFSSVGDHGGLDKV